MASRLGPRRRPPEALSGRSPFRRVARPRASLLAAVLVWQQPSQSSAKDALVFLGATGDNALRPSGVWQGIYEAFAGGDFDRVGGVDIHVAMNTPHTPEELHTKVQASLAGLYVELQGNSGWQCQTEAGDCSPARFMQDVSVNIWPGRDANAQAANMAPSLQEYSRITLYLSIPPAIFGRWAQAAVDNWGGGDKRRIHVAAEKPFGNSLEDAQKLHDDLLAAGVLEANLHLVDHWLSFFMNRNLPTLRHIVGRRLGASWDASGISKVVITEYEERGLQGRGGFFDGVGQVRDMVQSHLLQVLALALVDPTAKDIRAAKLAILNRTTVAECRLAQYDGFLLQPKLTYHPDFADATLCELTLGVEVESWQGVPVVIATGKAMGDTRYTVEYHRRGGPGVLTFEVGKEETGLGGVRVTAWKLRDDSEIIVPGPGFASAAPLTVTPKVSEEGSGYVVNYTDPRLYFPKPYALMAASLLTHDYEQAFVAYPACERSWQIVTAGSPARCMQPAPSSVRIYREPHACGNAPPDVCWQNATVEDLYRETFSCSSEHDRLYANVSIYQAKCHPPSRAPPAAVVFV